jgi:hypothetical protein
VVFPSFVVWRERAAIATVSGIMDNVDPDAALEVARQALGFPQTEDKEALRLAINLRIDAMHPLDSIAFRLDVARLYPEHTSAEKMTPSFHVIGCLITVLIPLCLSVLVSRLIAVAHLRLLFTIPLVIADLILIFVFVGSARALSRAITQGLNRASP